MLLLLRRTIVQPQVQAAFLLAANLPFCFFIPQTIVVVANN
jgi:hypothetical protein